MSFTENINIPLFSAGERLRDSVTKLAILLHPEGVETGRHNAGGVDLVFTVQVLGRTRLAIPCHTAN